MERKYAWHNYDDATMEKVYALSDTYRQFLDNGKTERECVVQAVELAGTGGHRRHFQREFILCQHLPHVTIPLQHFVLTAFRAV